MIVDCHTHIVSTANLGASEHLEAAEPVDVSFVLACADGPADEVNRAVSEYVEKHEAKMVGFAAIDPTADSVGVRAVRAATEKAGLTGIVVYCAQHAFHPAHSRAMRLYEAAQELGLPVFFHNSPIGADGSLEYAQPYLLDEIARTFRGLKIVVGGMGLPFYQQTLYLVAKNENVFADLSVRPGNMWQLYNVLMAAHEQDVMSKLLFGSGFPAARPTQCIETLLGLNRLLGEANLPAIPRGSIRAVIEQNALALLCIQKQVAPRIAESDEHGEDEQSEQP